MALAVRSGRAPHVLKDEWSSMEFRMLAEYHRHCPIDDRANHHIPIAMLHASVRNLMGGTSKASDFLIYKDGDGDAELEFMQEMMGEDLADRIEVSDAPR